MTGKKVLYIISIVFLLGSLALIWAMGNRDGSEVAVQSEASTGETAAGTEYDKDAYPPNGWTESMADAAARAQAEGKMILMNFTGSDWCVWCQKLTKEVFSTPEFLSWADENLVMVFLDSPSSIVQDDRVVEQNQILQQVMGVQGFPTIFLLDSNLTPLLQTGYREGGAERAYIEHLENDRLEIEEESAENFRNGFSGLIEENLRPLDI